MCAVDAADRPANQANQMTRAAGFPRLLSAQFLGALNDNLYKMVVSLLVVDPIIGQSGGAMYLSLSGFVFILPYLLFSGYAGQLADRMNKRRVLVVAKALEIVVMLLAVPALMAGRVDLMLAVLFLLATQATFFSPAKYGILPEILPPVALGRANGALEMSRYLAVILGTVAGGAMLDQWRNEPAAIGAVLLVIAVVGWVACLGVGEPRRIASARTDRGAWTELTAGVRRLAADRLLRSVALGLIYFDLLSTLVMMALLLLVKDTLQLTNLEAGLVGGLVGVGLGLGCGLAGRLCRYRVPAWLVPVAALGIAAGLAGTWLLSSSSMGVAAGVLAAGLFGGLYVVPLLTLLQRMSRTGERGRVIGAVNFLGMTGVLLATALLWFLHDAMGMRPVDILLAAGAVSLVVPGVARWVKRGGLCSARGRSPGGSDRAAATVSMSAS
jgi:acyl-[acyl-carrier-protein]-phospholipid O-acyltransferase/long-chain-fatty-acid--[acyl-carrier-protein] ligase